MYDDVETPTRLAGVKQLPILAGTTDSGTAVAMTESLQICWHAGVIADAASGRSTPLLTGQPPNGEAETWMDHWLERFCDVSALLCLPRWVQQRRFPEFATDAACEYHPAFQPFRLISAIEHVVDWFPLCHFIHSIFA